MLNIDSFIQIFVIVVSIMFAIIMAFGGFAVKMLMDRISGLEKRIDSFEKIFIKIVEKQL